MTNDSCAAIDLGIARRKTALELTKEAQLKVLLYGRLADAIGRDIELDASDGRSIAELRASLAASYPSAADSLGRARAFVSDQLVGEEHVVSASGEVEFLPPVSGG